MVLSDTDLREALRLERIKISPEIDLETQLGSCAIDFRLGYDYRVFDYSRQGFIDTRQMLPHDLLREVHITDDQSFVIQPGELVLANTYESLEVPADMVARLDGRSSLGRLGIIVHGTAGGFYPGWRGVPTLELINLGRMAVALYPLMRICSFTFHMLSTPAEKPYGSQSSAKFMDQVSPKTGKLWSEFK